MSNLVEKYTEVRQMNSLEFFRLYNHLLQDLSEWNITTRGDIETGYYNDGRLEVSFYASGGIATVKEINWAVIRHEEEMAEMDARFEAMREEGDSFINRKALEARERFEKFSKKVSEDFERTSAEFEERFKARAEAMGFQL